MSANYADYIRPICIPSTTDSDHVGDVAIASGWGKFSDSNAFIISWTEAHSELIILFTKKVLLL